MRVYACSGEVADADGEQAVGAAGAAGRRAGRGVRGRGRADVWVVCGAAARTRDWWGTAAGRSQTRIVGRRDTGGRTPQPPRITRTRRRPKPSHEHPTSTPPRL